jgi:NADPH-dependent glutamate synthase beta subunit-like oxidoreductase
LNGIGVKIEYGKEMGRDFTVQSLREQGYQAVFLGIGMPAVCPIPSLPFCSRLW